jgi:hypothetical protein
VPPLVLPKRMVVVRAKFKCVKVGEEIGWGVRKDGTTGDLPMKTVRMIPVMDGSEENKRFFAATPSGAIDIGVLNPEAADAFLLGKFYYVDFTLVEAAQ